MDGLRKKKIITSKDAFEIFHAVLTDIPHEEFWILLLNRANLVISKHNISIGGLSGTVADSKIIFKLAIENLASSVILCHNHPSGNPKPSDADLLLTKKIQEAGSLLDVPVLDHLIIVEGGFYSFADEGLM